MVQQGDKTAQQISDKQEKQSPQRKGTESLEENKIEDESNRDEKNRNGKSGGDLVIGDDWNCTPLNTPIRRRLEMLAVIWHCTSIPFFACVFLVTLSLGFFFWLGIVVPYLIWWYCFDLETPTNGKSAYRIKPWVRNMVIWEWFVHYFPIRVHKMCELEPTYSDVMVETEGNASDEEDLVSEESSSSFDLLLKIGLRKRSIVSQNNGNGKNRSKKKLTLFKHLATGPRYIFGYHPHGVVSMGVMGAFANNVILNEPFEAPLRFLKSFFHDPSQGKRLLPGIGNVFPLTLTTQFVLPFYRDYLLSLGITSASANNIRKLISNGNNSVVLVIGGAQESLLNSLVKRAAENTESKAPNLMETESPFEVEKSERKIRLVLNKRKGFVKIAIELGNVALVPTFAFGEADVYNVVQPSAGSLAEKFQLWVKKNFLFTIPYFSARGVFFYNFGLIPYRCPINICMGRPIYVPPGLCDQLIKENQDNPTILQTETSKRPSQHIPQSIIDHYHSLYVDELKRVYEQNKAKFGYSDVELIITE